MCFTRGLSLAIRAVSVAIAVLGWPPTLAQSVDPTVPAPAGLVPCAPSDPVLVSMKRALPQSGTLAGCFKSQERVSVSSSGKAISVPLETAFSVVFHGAADRVYA